MTNSSGPSTEACGIPLTSIQLDVIPFTLTHWVRLVKNVLIQYKKSPFMPTFSSFNKSLVCDREGFGEISVYYIKGFAILNHVRPYCYLLSHAAIVFLSYFSNAWLHLSCRCFSLTLCLPFSGCSIPLQYVAFQKTYRNHFQI